MKFCISCGSELKGGKFCPECGTVISQNDTADQRTESNESSGGVNVEKLKKFLPNNKMEIEGWLSKVVVEDNKITITNNLEAKIEIPLNDITAIAFKEAKSFGAFGGFTIYTTDNKRHDAFFRPKHQKDFQYLFEIFTKKEIGIKVVDYVSVMQFTNKKAEKKKAIQERIAQNKATATACCPKCGSTSLSANKKGFGVGKAVVGMATPAGALGAIAGNINAKKVWVTCLNCGHRWKV